MKLTCLEIYSIARLIDVYRNISRYCQHFAISFILSVEFNNIVTGRKISFADIYFIPFLMRLKMLLIRKSNPMMKTHGGMRAQLVKKKSK